jgi:hypothetical protein
VEQARALSRGQSVAVLFKDRGSERRLSRRFSAGSTRLDKDLFRFSADQDSTMEHSTQRRAWSLTTS